MNILLEKSLINCHCEGMDSLVVKGAPGMVRIFIARHDHQLWRNHPDRMANTCMSVALHRHHCDITMMPIFGEIHNVEPSVSRDGTPVELMAFRYRSPISEGAGSFEPVDNYYTLPINLLSTKLTAPRLLYAHEPHTVYVPHGKTAAWFIWEGKENPKHNPIVYSNDPDLTDFDFSKLDQPMTPERLKQDLALISVLL